MKEELVKCPFCGDPARLVFVFDARRYRGECTSCGAAGPSAVTEHEATQAWNHRMQEKALSDEIRRLQFQMEKLAWVVNQKDSKEIARVYLDDWHKLYREINELRSLLLQAGAYVYRHAERQVGPATRLMERIEDTLQHRFAAAEK